MTDQFFGITDTGKEREKNEDTFIAQETADSEFIIACVIDGVGGYAGGEVAAAITRETILKQLESPLDDIISMAIDGFQQANELIVLEKQGKSANQQMACVATLAIVDIPNNKFYYAHVGDTRLYLFRDGSLVKITHDQSFVGYLEENGRLTEEEAMSHPKRNEINKALGFEGHLDKTPDYIETGQSPFLSGDMLLLCSDGLTDLVSSAVITNVLAGKGSLKEKGQRLIDAANHSGGKDNITVVLVQNNKVAPQHKTHLTERTAAVSDTKKSVTAQSHRVETHSSPAPKRNNGTVWVLIFLLLIFMAASGYLYFNRPVRDASPAKSALLIVKKPANEQEIKLQNAIDQVKGKILILSDTAYKSPIIIGRAIEISRDSLLIQAKGSIVLQCDSAYKGSAMILSPKCKSILLDSLSFANFSVGVSFSNSTLKLKNVRFLNCILGVQNGFALANKKYVSGNLLPPELKMDSLPLVNK